MNRLAVYFVIAFLGWASVSQAQMRVNTNQTSHIEANNVFAGAANTWASEFRDDITVTVQYGFLRMDPGTISTTNAGTQIVQYTDFWGAIGDDITTADDVTMFNGLPTGTSFSLYINQTQEASGAAFEVPYVDNDSGENNTRVEITSANAKALGLHDPHAATIDGFILFNSIYNWDFDPADGIKNNHLDFFGTALHEIGHTLGFQSGVDVLDGNGGGEFSDNSLPFVSSLDFLRYSNDSELAGADIDWTADSRNKYFSIDGGFTSVAGGSSHWSTGQNYGDGNQASHWKDGMNLGVMEPTIDFGLVSSISAMDLLAMDAIGYDRGFFPVPEPSSGMAVLLLLGGLVMRRRRSQKIC